MPKVNTSGLTQYTNSVGGLEKNERDIGALQQQNDKGRAGFVAKVKDVQKIVAVEAMKVLGENGFDGASNLPRGATTTVGAVVEVAANATLGAVGDAIALGDALRRAGRQANPAQLAKIQAQIQSNLASSPSGSGTGSPKANETAFSMGAPAPEPQSQKYNFDQVSGAELWALLQDVDVTQQPEIKEFDRADQALKIARETNDLAAKQLMEITPENVQVARNEPVRQQAMMRGAVNDITPTEAWGMRADLGSMSGLSVGGSGVNIDPHIRNILRPSEEFIPNNNPQLVSNFGLSA